MSNKLYWYFAYLGLMSVSGSFLIGFGHDPAASAANYLFNVGLFIAFISVHMLMTLPAFKKLVFGSPQGSPSERRVYIAVWRS